MSCTNPPAPTGYQVWKGSVPAPLTAWAISLRDHIARYPLGTTWTMPYNGQMVLARCDCHSWTYRNGQLITGLEIKGITLYSPRPGAFVDVTNTGDPLASPNVDMSEALFDSANTPGPSIDWPLVLLSGGAIAAIVTGFVLALKYAGAAASHR